MSSTEGVKMRWERNKDGDLRLITRVPYVRKSRSKHDPHVGEKQVTKTVNTLMESGSTGLNHRSQESGRGLGGWISGNE